MDINTLSRIDRAVADNIKDIERSFGGQAGIVQDFIVFISRRLKTDLFGYTRFTLQEFCIGTGRRRQELALIHPDFASGKVLPPMIQGYAFNTVMDYALYSMMERNIIFSARYEVTDKESVIQMHNFPILKDLRLNFSRRDKEQKVYEIRLSDELLQGFLSRYYTLDAESYRRVGKGRGGDSRKKLLLYLSKICHVLTSTGQTETTLPVDRLCQFADITDLKPSHKKQALSRMLSLICVVGHFPLDYEFVSGSGYMVRLLFRSPLTKRIFQTEHNFYLRLMSGLQTIHNGKSAAQLIIDEDPFQAWLVAAHLDIEAKAQVLAQTYYICLNLTITQAYAILLIQSGEFLKPFPAHVQ
jgi:hypothetical protein